MGYSMSQERHEKLERLRRHDRLCGMNNGRGGCGTKATTGLVEESWSYGQDKLDGKPPMVRDDMKLCSRHARQMPPGFEGVNFRVLSHFKLGPPTLCIHCDWAVTMIDGVLIHVYNKSSACCDVTEEFRARTPWQDFPRTVAEVA